MTGFSKNPQNDWPTGNTLSCRGELKDSTGKLSGVVAHQGTAPKQIPPHESVALGPERLHLHADRGPPVDGGALHQLRRDRGSIEEHAVNRDLWGMAADRQHVVGRRVAVGL